MLVKILKVFVALVQAVLFYIRAHALGQIFGSATEHKTVSDVRRRSKISVKRKNFCFVSVFLFKLRIAGNKFLGKFHSRNNDDFAFFRNNFGVNPFIEIEKRIAAYKKENLGVRI